MVDHHYVSCLGRFVLTYPNDLFVQPKKIALLTQKLEQRPDMNIS